MWRKSGGTQTEYDEWRANFGESVHAGAGAGGGSAGVPEPAAAVYLGQVFGLLAIAAIARRSRRRLIACVYYSRGL